MFGNYLIKIFFIAGVSTSEFSFSSSLVRKTETSLTGPFGTVQPTDCGSTDSLIDTRVSGCDALPCDLTFQTLIEIAFFARGSDVNAKLKRTVTPKGQSPITTTEDYGPILGGKIHFLTLTNFTTFITSQEVTLKIEIPSPGAVELCVEGLFNKDRIPGSTTEVSVADTTAGGAMPATSAGIGMVALLFGTMHLFKYVSINL